MEDFKKKKKEIQKEYIKHDEFSTMKKDFDTFSKKSYFYIFWNPVKTR